MPTIHHVPTLCCTRRASVYVANPSLTMSLSEGRRGWWHVNGTASNTRSLTSVNYRYR
jgi:hypothetical protein